MPGGTVDWALASWRGVWGPRLSTFAAVGSGWPGGGLGPLLLLLQQHRDTVFCLKTFSSTGDEYSY